MKISSKVVDKEMVELFNKGMEEGYGRASFADNRVYFSVDYIEDEGYIHWKENNGCGSSLTVSIWDCDNEWHLDDDGIDLGVVELHDGCVDSMTDDTL